MSASLLSTAAIISVCRGSALQVYVTVGVSPVQQPSLGAPIDDCSVRRAKCNYVGDEATKRIKSGMWSTFDPTADRAPMNGRHSSVRPRTAY